MAATTPAGEENPWDCKHHSGCPIDLGAILAVCYGVRLGRATGTYSREIPFKHSANLRNDGISS